MQKVRARISSNANKPHARAIRPDGQNDKRIASRRARREDGVRTRGEERRREVASDSWVARARRARRADLRAGVSSRLLGSRDREFGACTHRLAYAYICVYIYARLGHDRRQVERRSSGWLATLADRLAEHDARLRRHVRCTIGEVQGDDDGDERRRRDGGVGERGRGRDGEGSDVEEVRGTAVDAVCGEQLFVLQTCRLSHVGNGARGPRPVLEQSAHRYPAGDILVFAARNQNKSLPGIQKNVRERERERERQNACLYVRVLPLVLLFFTIVCAVN